MRRTAIRLARAELAARRSPLAAVLACAILAACATPPGPPASPDASLATLEQRRLDDPRLSQFLTAARRLDNTPAPPPWTLASLSLAALYFHPDLDLARSQLALARAGTVTAAERPNPSVSFVPPPWLFGGVVSAVIETFGKRSGRIAAADRLAQAARADLDTASWQVRAGVRAALLDVWAARRRGALLAERAGQQAALVAEMQRRLSAGDAAAPEVTRERMALDQLRLAQNDAARAEAEAVARLARAIGVPARALDGQALALDPFDRPVTLDLARAEGTDRRAALTGRADLRARLAELDAAQAALGIELASRFPNVTLGPGYNWYQGIGAFAVAPTFELPILNQNQGRIGEALARRDAAAARLVALQARILGEIEQATAGMRAAERGLAAASALLREQDGRVEAIARAVAAGAADRPALLAAEVERGLVRQGWLDALAAEHQAAGALEDALQVPLVGPASAAPDPETNPRAAMAGP